MKKIAVLGDVESIWIRSYVRNVLAENKDSKIVVISDKKSKEYEFNDLENVKVEFCVPGSLSKLLKLSVLSYYVKVLVVILKNRGFDFFHVHYVNKRKLFVTYRIRKLVKSIILTYWGSDLLRQTANEHRKTERKLAIADVITVGSSGMEEYFKATFSAELCKKLRLVRFGVNGITAIDYVIQNGLPTREIWNIPKDCIVITIGYNGAREQNHISVLAEIKKLPKDILQRIFIILPMTYGLSADYQNDVEKIAMDVGCQYLILTEYMEAIPTAQLRLATDIFIHAQNTDALSASMQEYLYAKKLVINPVWLQYNDLKERNVSYWEFAHFEELGVLLEKYVINGMSEAEKEKLSSNTQIIYRYSSWSSLYIAWKELYTAKM